MSKLIVTSDQKRAIGIATIIAIVGGAIFLRPYFTLIIFSMILAFLFSPIYERLLKRSNKPGRSSMLTLLIAALLIVIPVTLIVFMCFRQIDNLLSGLDYNELSKNINELINKFNTFITKIPVKIDPQAVSNTIESGLQSAGQKLVSFLPGVFDSFLAFITNFIIFIYVFLAILRYKNKLLEMTHTINPLGKEISTLYADKMSAMTKATVRGQFIIAFCQGLESSIVMSIAGLGNLFFFFLIFLTALSVIPMGAGIVTIPIGIFMILTGNVWQGALIILNHLLIVTNIDNVLRPQLVPKSARLNSALMMLAVFSGIAMFGFLGIVVGPVIMILIVTTIQVFLEVYRNIEMEKDNLDLQKNISLYKKATSRAKELIRLPAKD